MQQPDRLFLVAMIDACSRILTLVNGRSAQDIEDDPMRREALLWNFTVLGEAASQVGDGTKAAHTDVPWRRMAGTRNRIVHGYWSVDVELLVTTAHENVPAVVEQLKVALSELSD